MGNLQVFFYLILSVALMTCGIPNELLYFGSPLAGLLALVPFYLALDRIRTPRQAGLLTSLFLGLTHLTTSFWLANFKEFAILTLGGSAFVYFFSGYFIGQILHIPFRLSHEGRTRLQEQAGIRPWNLISRILFFACAWTVHEWGKSSGFLAYPWGTLIMTAWRWKTLTQVVALTGTWGISFLFSLFAAVVAEGVMLLSHTRKHVSEYAHAAAFCLTLFLCTVCYGTIEYAKPRTPVKYINTVIVQHNSDSWQEDPQECLRTAERLTDSAILSSDLEPDLVVFSECILPFYLPDYWDILEEFPFQRPLLQAIRQTGVPYIIGAPWVADIEEQRFENSAILVDGDGNLVDHYAKIHLVPFAESIPYSDQAWMKKLMMATAGFSSGWSSGTAYTLFTVEGSPAGSTTAERVPVSVSAPVCFEDAFPEVCRGLFLKGSEVFMNITNDSWSLTKSAEYQHYVMASYRAQEFRTTLVRTTNGGYSCVTDPAGRILEDLPLFRKASVLTKVPVYERVMTPYALIGDWVPALAGFMLILYILQYLHSQKRAKKSC